MPPPPDPSYNTVPERIAQFRAKHPDGRIRPVDPERPYWWEWQDDVNDDGQPVKRGYVVYAAAAYRTAADPLPGIGLAWEPWPGATPYTADSELMNAETSAWGRAIVAALAADTNKGIASAEEVRARQEGASPAALRDATWWLVQAARGGMDLDVDRLLDYAAKSDAHAAKLVVDLGARMAEEGITVPDIEPDTTADVITPDIEPPGDAQPVDNGGGNVGAPSDGGQEVRS